MMRPWMRPTVSDSGRTLEAVRPVRTAVLPGLTAPLWMRTQRRNNCTGKRVGKTPRRQCYFTFGRLIDAAIVNLFFIIMQCRYWHTNNTSTRGAVQYKGRITNTIHTRTALDTLHCRAMLAGDTNTADRKTVSDHLTCTLDQGFPTTATTARRPSAPHAPHIMISNPRPSLGSSPLPYSTKTA
jgi:hypothetical protein